MSSLQSKAKDVLGQGLFTTTAGIIAKQTFQKSATNATPSRFGVKTNYQNPVRMSAADEQPSFQVTHQSLPQPSSLLNTNQDRSQPAFQKSEYANLAQNNQGTPLLPGAQASQLRNSGYIRPSIYNRQSVVMNASNTNTTEEITQDDGDSNSTKAPLAETTVKNPFSWYSYVVLAILFMTRLCHQQQQQALGFIYGYKGQGAMFGSKFFEITASYPQLTQYYGLLSGAGFSISFAVAGILWGLYSEKASRKYIAALACIGWSLTTYFTGAINSFGILVFMRFLLGATQGALEPAMFGIMQDYFPKSKITTANSILTAAPYLGAGISSLNVVIIASYGWRAALKLMGGLGVAIGLAGVFFMREPERGRFDRYEEQVARAEGRELPPKVVEKEDDGPKKNIAQNFMTSLSDCVKNPVTRWCTVATMFRFVAMFACDYYVPAFFLGQYPKYRAQFSVLYAAMCAVCGLTSSIQGGVLSDKFKGKSHQAFSYIAIGGALLSWPFQVVSCLTLNNFWISITGVGGKYLFGENFWGPNIAMISNSCPPAKLGNYISAQNFFNILAGCLTTLIFGSAVNTFNLANNPALIGRLVAVFCSIGYGGSCFAWWKAGKNYKKMQEAEGNFVGGDVAPALA